MNRTKGLTPGVGILVGKEVGWEGKRELKKDEKINQIRLPALSMVRLNE